MKEVIWEKDQDVAEMEILQDEKTAEKNPLWFMTCMVLIMFVVAYVLVTLR